MSETTDGAQNVPAVITREEYLAGKATHEEYYAQFVTQATKDNVRMRFPHAELVAAFAEDESLNTIPLLHWERFSFSFLDREMRHFVSCIVYDHEALAAAGDYATRAGLVCISKMAARLVLEEGPR